MAKWRVGGKTKCILPLDFLSKQENEELMKIQGKDRLILSVARVKLYRADDLSDKTKWNLKCEGVCVLHKRKGTLLFRLYNLEDKVIVWEVLVTDYLGYTAPRPYFHTFYAYGIPTAFYFTQTQQAAKFKADLKTSLKTKSLKKIFQNMLGSRNKTNNRSCPQSEIKHFLPVDTYDIEPNYQDKANGDCPKSRRKLFGIFRVPSILDRKKKKRKERSEQKAKIGSPVNFRHEVHVSYNKEQGYIIESLNPNLKAMFKEIGLPKKALQDRSLLAYIMEFIRRHGGLEAVIREQSRNNSPVQTTPLSLGSPKTDQDNGWTGSVKDNTPPPWLPPPRPTTPDYSPVHTSSQELSRKNPTMALPPPRHLSRASLLESSSQDISHRESLRFLPPPPPILYGHSVDQRASQCLPPESTCQPGYEGHLISPEKSPLPPPPPRPTPSTSPLRSTSKPMITANIKSSQAKGVESGFLRSPAKDDLLRDIRNGVSLKKVEHIPQQENIGALASCLRQALLERQVPLRDSTLDDSLESEWDEFED